jgi:enoyl-[acyl-carrier protein] reductase I
MKLLSGKKGIIMGVANERSIAWGIAQKCHEHGAQIAFTYQSEVLEKRLRPLAESINNDFLIECDVAKEESIALMIEKVKQKFEKIDFIVHSLAFAGKDALRGDYCNVTKEDFLNSMDISVYSLTSVMRHAREILNDGASVITMTYYGAEKVVPNYNVMGVAKAALEASVMYLANDFGKQNIRVNSISAGPIKTLAASGIGDFKSVLSYNENNSPLKRNVTQHDVAGTAIYLLSDLSSGVTGEKIHVDCGVNVIGMPGDLK